jgi:hypothetical protein
MVGLLWMSTQDNTTYTKKTDIHAPSGVTTCNPSNQATKDLHLRMLGHWNLQQDAGTFTKSISKTLSLDLKELFA